MAVITQTTGAIGSPSPTVLVRTNLSGSDTLTYNPGTGQKLVLFGGGAAVTVNIVGTAPTSPPVPRYGIFDTSAGKSITVAINNTVIVSLDDIAQYLSGTLQVTITNGTGLAAYLYT